MPVLDVQIMDRPVEAMDIEPFPGGAGAECALLGRTRADVHPRYGRLYKLVYSAYGPLAERTLRDLAQCAAQRYGCHLVRVHHALGEVPVGESSVLVQVVGAHRDKAFEACRFIIDRLKATAPIWKKEQWALGTTWSRGNPVRVDGGLG